MDDSQGEPRLLLGRRGDSHVFMPGKFVFPGGRVDPADLKLATSIDLDLPVLGRLLVQTPTRFGLRHAAAVALAGIRETFEEAGLMVGTSSLGGPAIKAGGTWDAFAAAGIAPDLSVLVPVARAITPPGHVRRYDTRFFCVGIETVRHRIPFDGRFDRELDSLGWFTLAEASALDLPDITRHVLDDIGNRLRDGTWRDPARCFPFYRTRHRRLVRDMI